MKKPIYSIYDDYRIGTAQDLMKAYGAKYLLVEKRDGKYYFHDVPSKCGLNTLKETCGTYRASNPGTSFTVLNQSGKEVI